MAIKSIDQIKATFETGDIPTQAQYADFIDSSYNHFVDFIATPAQMIASDVTPIVLIPAPPDGFIHQIIANPIVTLQFNSIDFNFSGTNSFIRYESTFGKLYNVKNQFLDQGIPDRFEVSDRFADAKIFPDAIVFEGSSNTGIGNSTVVFSIAYRVIQIF